VPKFYLMLIILWKDGGMSTQLVSFFWCVKLKSSEKLVINNNIKCRLCCQLMLQSVLNQDRFNLRYNKWFLLDILKKKEYS